MTDDLCTHDGERVTTLAGHLSIHPPTTALLLCVDCGYQLGYAPTLDALEIAQDAADIMANSTGSVSATHVSERRSGGMLVVEASVVSRPLAQRQAIRAARQAAAEAAAAEAVAQEAQDQMDRAIWGASSDLTFAADLARRAGLDTIADALVVLAGNCTDLMAPSITTAAF